MTNVLLNPKKIDKLAIEIGNENVPLLLDIFLGELAMYREMLDEKVGEGKVEYLKEISHALKSSAASFGADALCCSAMMIDNKAKLGDPILPDSDVEEMLSQLKSTHQAYFALVSK